MKSLFNPELLQIARQFRGVSQKSITDQVRITQGYFSKLEKGTMLPKASDVQQIADILNFPLCFFYQTDDVYSLPISIHPMFRKRNSLGQKKLNKILAELNIRLIHIRFFLKNSWLTSSYELPKPSPVLIEPEQTARMVRQIWRVQKGSLNNLVDFVEKSGCLVIMCDFQDTRIDGVTMSLPKLPHCIFVNKNMSADRFRFTLAHELGHIVLHSIPSENMEQEANDFAAELLMPANDIEDQLVKLDIYKLSSLKPVWKVSMAALLMRAKKLNTLREQQINYLWRQLSAAGYRTKEPPELDFEKEKPTVLEMYIDHTLNNAVGNEATLYEQLCIREDEFKRMYFIE